jgi:hypothetical protein
MPIVKHLYRESGERHAELRDRLLTEIREPKATGQPVIAMEPDQDRPQRVTVIWDEWEGLNLQERSEIISDVIYKAEEVGRVKDSSRLVYALGLTTADANKMKVRY